MTDSPAADALCPLCGKANRCAIAAGNAPESCWCWHADIDAEAREQAADTATKRCLCPACGQPTTRADHAR
ncbi:MAG: cysteine-rich CWC family protein [Halioglobus sp.]|nr:cysteine-rich CWC family protein [Halioglobus sp.]